MISTKLHGYLDYLMGAFLIATPYLFGFPQGLPTMLPIILGAGTILYSLLTAYELGAYGLIPMPVHLIIDLMAGILLILAPWIFGFADQVYLPFVILGAIEVLASLMTAKKPLTPDLEKH